MTKKIYAALLAVGLAVPLAASAQDAGVFKVPGTDSTIKFYGYAQFDTTLDLSGRVGDVEDNDWATFLPGVPLDNSIEGKRKKPQLYFTTRTSRFGIQTTTPTKMGNIGVRLEGDFNAPNQFQGETFTNSVIFRLRHAYGTVGNLLVGQTWSTFLDLGAAPDTVDFNGPGSLALVRNPMIRYALPLGPGMSLSLAAENARGANRGGDKFQVIPDLHANFTYSGNWGHISARGVTQYFSVALGTDVAAATKMGFAGALSGSFKVGGDTLVAQASGGPGIGRYLLNALGSGNVGYSVVGQDLELWTVMAYHLGYTHVWNPEFRSSLVWSQTFITDPKLGGVAAADGTFEKDMMQAFVNLFYSFAKNAEFGIEYAYGQYKLNGSGEKGTQHRINASFHYNFY